MKLVALAMMIPFILAIPPILGWWIGNWIDEKSGFAPYFMYLFIILGVIAGYKEVYRIVRRFVDDI